MAMHLDAGRCVLQVQVRNLNLLYLRIFIACTLRMTCAAILRTQTTITSILLKALAKSSEYELT